MKIFKDLKELSEGPKVIFEDFLRYSKDFPIPNECFQDLYGGDVILIESPEELLDLTDVPCDMDVAYLTGNLEYMVVSLYTSDTGGALFVIPKRLYEKSTLLLMSLVLTHSELLIND